MIRLAFVVPLLATSLLSQQKSILSPPAFTNIYTGSHNGIPFGGYQSNEQLYQQVDEGIKGSTRLLSGMVFSHSWSVDYPARSFDLELRIGNAATTASTISATYSQNFKSTPTQVFSGTINWPRRSRGFTLPGPYDSAIDFSAPWAYTGSDPICWEVYIKSYSGFTNGSSDQYYAMGYTRAALTRKYWAGTMGTGCYPPGANPSLSRPPVSHGFVNSAVAELAESLTFGPPNSPVVVKMGLPADNWSGLPLPLNLSLIGMSPSCNLYIAPLADVFFGKTDSTGRAEMKLPFTYTAALGGQVLRTQWFSMNAARTQFTSVSNGLNHLIPLDGTTKTFPIARNWGTTFGTTKPTISTGRSTTATTGGISQNYGLLTLWRHL